MEVKERKAIHILPSSTLASLLTALVVNPLEVLKVRQQKGQSDACHIHNNPISKLRLSFSLQKLKQSSSDIIKCSPISHPLKSLPRSLTLTQKTQNCLNFTQNHNNKSKWLSKLPKFHYAKSVGCLCLDKQNLLRGFGQIIRTEGISPLLFNGLRYSLYSAMTTTVTYFYLYEKVTSLISKSVTKNQIALPLLSAAISRSFSTTLTFPLEYWRTLQHAQVTVGRQLQANKQKAPLGAAFFVTLQRDILFSSIYWVLVENIRTFSNEILNEINSEINSFISNDEVVLTKMPQNTSKSTISNIIAGSIAGATTAILTLPLDVIKTKRQLHESYAKVSTYQTLKRIVDTEGIKGLYSGIRPRVAKAIISCSSMLSLYEFFYGISETLY